MARRPTAIARTLALGACLASLGAAGACDPYERFGQDGDSLGPVDPVNFPAANLGTRGDRKRAGLGTFTEVRAFVDGMPVGYFAYALPALPAGADPRRVLDEGKPYASVPTPRAYVFDAREGRPFPERYDCTPPEGYTYDPRRDEVRADEQGNVFAALPQATYSTDRAATTTYVPVVAEVPVSSAGQACQRDKSEKLVAHTRGLASADDLTASGRYLAWLVIDPAAAVYPLGESARTMHPGLGLQRWGWYNRYLLAYLDGGYVPTAEEMVMEGTPPAPRRVRRLGTQRLYHPRSVVVEMGPNMMPVMAPGRIGAGYDVLEAKRGDGKYSPLCAVFTYDAGMPLRPDELPKEAATIEAMFNTQAAPLRPGTPPLVYCLQVKAP